MYLLHGRVPSSRIARGDAIIASSDIETHEAGGGQTSHIVTHLKLSYVISASTIIVNISIVYRYP